MSIKDVQIVNQVKLPQRMSLSDQSEHPINAVFLDKNDKQCF